MIISTSIANPQGVTLIYTPAPPHPAACARHVNFFDHTAPAAYASNWRYCMAPPQRPPPRSVSGNPRSAFARIPQPEASAIRPTPVASNAGGYDCKVGGCSAKWQSVLDAPDRAEQPDEGRRGPVVAETIQPLFNSPVFTRNQRPWRGRYRLCAPAISAPSCQLRRRHSSMNAKDLLQSTQVPTPSSNNSFRASARPKRLVNVLGARSSNKMCLRIPIDHDQNDTSACITTFTVRRE
jgi:hypothetical protein